MGTRNLIMTAVLLIALLAVASPQMLDNASMVLDGKLTKPDTKPTASQKAWDDAVKANTTPLASQVVIGGGEVGSDGTRTPLYPAKDDAAAETLAAAGSTGFFDGGGSVTNSRCATVTDQLLAQVFSATVDDSCTVTPSTTTTP